MSSPAGCGSGAQREAAALVRLGGAEHRVLGSPVDGQDPPVQVVDAQRGELALAGAGVGGVGGQSWWCSGAARAAVNPGPRSTRSASKRERHHQPGEGARSCDSGYLSQIGMKLATDPREGTETLTLGRTR